MKIQLPNPRQFLSEEFNLYYQIYKNHEQQIEGLRQTKGRTAKSQARIDALIEAKECNSVLLHHIVEALRPSIDLEYLFSKSNNDSGRGSNNTHAYLKDFRYLKRDWCPLPESEAQLNVIVDALKKQIARLGTHFDSILFLGAGLGRIAFEHNDLFKKVYALDKSFSMVYHFNQLLEKDITFYEINELNVLKAEDTTRKLTASIKQASSEALNHKDRFEYFVGDAMALTFGDRSLSCITSVYFTDVIALKLYLEEIKRVLQIGGLYIHFGPLDYFFGDRSEMLSAEEIKDDFEANGFESLYEEVIELPHMASTLAMSKRVYTNWFYVARKIKEIDKRFSVDAVYIVNHPIYIQERKELGKKEILAKELINSKGDAFEGAGSIEDLLRFFDGKHSLEAILHKIKEEYDLEGEEVQQIQSIFEMLYKQDFLTKKA